MQLYVYGCVSISTYHHLTTILKIDAYQTNNKFKSKKIYRLTFQSNCSTSASTFPGTLVANILAISRRVTAISGEALKDKLKLMLGKFYVIHFVHLFLNFMHSFMHEYQSTHPHCLYEDVQSLQGRLII